MSSPPSHPAAPPRTFWLGLAIIIACEVLLFVDVTRRGWLLVPYDALPSQLPEPVGALGHVARTVAVNMTAICWVAYLLLFDGILTWIARRRDLPRLSSIRARPNRFIVAWLTSIPVWCVFDGLNFYLLDAWRYHGLPPSFPHRAVGYFIAFAAISPGMFLAAQLFQHLGLRRLRLGVNITSRRIAWFALLGVPLLIVLALTPIVWTKWSPAFALASAAMLLLPAVITLALTRSASLTSFAVGVPFVAWVFLAADPVANMTLWVGLIYLLDPVNRWLRAPSILEDWFAGRFGRTVALFAGGALCGLFWEFWNYWAIAKWTYHLPFLGGLQQVSYFEMPLLGFLGFLPFAVECWVMLNFIIALLLAMRLRVAEPLPDHDTVL